MVREEEEGGRSRRLENAPGVVVKNATAGAADRVVAGGDEGGEGPRLIQLATWRQLGLLELLAWALPPKALVTCFSYAHIWAKFEHFNSTKIYLYVLKIEHLETISDIKPIVYHLRHIICILLVVSLTLEIVCYHFDMPNIFFLDLIVCK